MIDPTWLTDERIRQIKHGEEATIGEVLALAGEVRDRRRHDDKQDAIRIVVTALCVIAAVLTVAVWFIWTMLS